MFLILLASGYFLVFIPLSETAGVFERGLMGYYQIIVTFIFIVLYFLMVTISFIFAFLSKKDNREGIADSQRLYLWKIIFAIIIFHNLSMIAYRTYLKHQDYGLRNVGKFYFQEMGQWLRKNSNKNDVVMCDDPIALGVFSERSCVQFPKVHATQDIIDTIQKENAGYVLVENNKRPRLNNLREIEVFYMLNFKEIMQVEGNLLFKIESRNLQ